jgi:hypothetical protein
MKSPKKKPTVSILGHAYHARLSFRRDLRALGGTVRKDNGCEQYTETIGVQW